MAPQNQTFLITGANRGIGFAITQATAIRYPNNTFLLGCRSAASGNEAITELRKAGVTSTLEVVQLDVTNNYSITAAVDIVRSKYRYLDVLVNNAGIGIFPKSQKIGDLRENFNTTFNANISSVMAITTAFLSLLHLAPEPKVINISSGRASLSRSSSGNLPPTAVVAYSVSKAALNSLTIELQKAEDALVREREGGEGEGEVEFWAANPGHCKTAFNGFKGKKDPLEGAEVIVRLVGGSRGEFKRGGFWEFEEGGMREVPW